MTRRSLEVHDHSKSGSGGAQLNPTKLAIPEFATDSEAPNETLYFESTAEQVRYKDENGTVHAEDTSIDNIVYRQGTIGSITSHVGDRVTIAGDALETIFDVAGTVDVMSGTIVGPDVGRLVVTWDDATADDIYPDSKHFGEDNAGNLYSAHNVPPIKDASKLEIKNGGGSSGIFGYMVRTI